MKKEEDVKSSNVYDPKNTIGEDKKQDRNSNVNGPQLEYDGKSDKESGKGNIAQGLNICLTQLTFYFKESMSKYLI